MHQLYSNEYIIRKNNALNEKVIFRFIITIITLHLIPVTFVFILSPITYRAFNTLK